MDDKKTISLAQDSRCCDKCGAEIRIHYFEGRKPALEWIWPPGGPCLECLKEMCEAG